MTSISLTSDLLNHWATDPQGPVALHFQQNLIPVEGSGTPFFPPTFAAPKKGADSGYNIDTLADGTKVALVDSVGSQANRIEPIFAEKRFKDFVPQVTITYGDKKKGTQGQISLLETGHRLGDAVVRCTELKDDAREAFQSILSKGDASPLANIAPTSIVFGVWDSRDTQAKLPRIVQCTVRAWDVSTLTRSAQYNPALDYAGLEVFSDTDREKAEGDTKNPLAKRGFVHNPASGSHGGVIALGPIRRDVTVNLIALRRLRGDSDESSNKLRRYILGLSLIAAVEPVDAFLRQGCLLVPDVDSPAQWQLADRDGTRTVVNLDPKVLLDYLKNAAKGFGVGKNHNLTFDKNLAKADIKNKK